MKTKSTLLLGIAVFTSLQSTAFAQHEGSGSHGGNGVVCFSSPKYAEQLTQPDRVVSKTIPDSYLANITSVETLELYEARVGVYGDALSDLLPIGATETENEYIERITNRFSNWTPVLKKMIDEGKKIIGNRVQKLNDSSLIPVEDIRPLSRAKDGCIYTNVAQQASLGSSAIKRLVIDNRLYSRSDALSRAVLMIHEYVLAYTTYYLKNTDSEGARNIVIRMIAKNTNAADMSVILETFGMKDESLGERVVPAAVASLEKLTLAANSEYGADAIRTAIFNKNVLPQLHNDCMASKKAEFDAQLNAAVQSIDQSQISTSSKMALKAAVSKLKICDIKTTYDDYIAQLLRRIPDDAKFQASELRFE